MLAIRLQRTGRKGHAQFRFIVQDSRSHPKRGKVVAYLGNYNPHDKSANIDGEKASQYLAGGAQPSDRVARLLSSEGIKLPTWVKLSDPKKSTIRHPQKLRKNRPAEPAPEQAPAPSAEEVPEQTPAAPTEEEPTQEQSTEEQAPSPEETPAPEEVSEAPAETSAQVPAQQTPENQKPAEN